MKRFTFGLEKILELREYHERIAKTTLGEKAGKCTILDMELEENARKTLVAGRERFRRGGNASDYLAGEHYALRLGSERERLMKALALAEVEREKARLTYIEASKSKQLIVKLKEREAAEYYKAAARDETKSMDDIAAIAHAHGLASAGGS
ncbi:MAG: flagellar export protein FliJ [Spirochaetia bacterium]|jgi:flagellar FliJ protein|nr:flagellar export protein FliJ [Spirochaetia bacterium]